MDLYNQISSTLEEKSICLVAVSKTNPLVQIQEFYNLGQRVFGENRVNELVEKHNELPKDINWHMIGHLQKNKVKYIAPFIALIHSVDNIKLAEIIDKEAKKNNRIIDVLLQIKVSEEIAKTGFSFDDLVAEIDLLIHMENINIVGIMGMGTFTTDQNVTEQEFKKMKNYFEKLKSKYFNEKSDFKELSMGMSGDYEIAINHGSTMVRIGSLLFGSR